MSDRAPRLIRLPRDGMAAVITMEIRGGYAAVSLDKRPRLTVFADGKVRVIDGSDFGPIESKISPDELQDLLRFAIDEQNFFDFDSEAAQRDLDAEQSRTGVSWTEFDGLLSVIRIRTAEREHKAEFYALYEYATAFPGLKPLSNLYAVEKRLSRLFNEIRAGGKESIAAALRLANEHLQKSYPNVAALALEDFLYVDDTPDGRTMHFVRTLAERQPAAVEDGFRRVFFGELEFSVAVAYLKDGTLKITVNNPPQ